MSREQSLQGFRRPVVASQCGECERLWQVLHNVLEFEGSLSRGFPFTWWTCRFAVDPHVSQAGCTAFPDWRRLFFGFITLMAAAMHALSQYFLFTNSARSSSLVGEAIRRSICVPQ